MDISVQINEVLKTGVKKVETFNGVTVSETIAKLNITQSLKFASFLSSRCGASGRTESTLNGKNLLTDWYDINKGSISINHITGKALMDKTSYYTISWAVEK